MTVQVVVVNGGSSSGKTTLARHLQKVMPGSWVTFGVDTLGDAVPGLDVGSGGEVAVGEEFERIESAWLAGLATMVRAGVRLVYDDVFLGGPRSQARVRRAFEGLDVLWVGVRCDPAVAAAREAVRGDRTPGMAALQAEVVHDGVFYDIEVDTGTTPTADCALKIALHIATAVGSHRAGAC